MNGQSSSDSVMTPGEAAEYLKLPVRQLQWRYLGRGPASHAGRQVRYRRDDLDAWLESHRVEPKGAS